MIRTEGLTKVFGGRDEEFLAVDALDLEVSEGEVFGFLGPNGAGKTTTVRMLATLVGASAGRAWVNGIQVGTGNDAQIRARIGILTESPGLYERLSAERNALLVLAPLLTVLAVSAAIIVSSRASDPAAAQQVGGLVVLPLVLLLISTLSGLVQLSGTVFWIAAALVAAVDAVLLRLGVQLFQRESILTRWK